MSLPRFVIFALLVSSGLLTDVTAQQPPAKPADSKPEEKPPADDGDELPKYEDMQVPTVKQLLLEPPVDWIRLKNTDEVIVTEPLFPRPDTLKKLEQKIEEMNKNRPVGMAELEKWRNERIKLNYLNVVLPGGGDAPEFRLETKKVEEIIYHEELLLRRVDLLVEADEQRQAFELLYQLERRLPDWPGLDDRKNHLLFMEAEGFRKKKDAESALVFYEQLHDRKPDYPELKQRMGEVVDTLISAAVGAQDYRRARHYLGRLRQREKTHEIVKKWETDLEQRAAELMKKGEAATAEGKHDVAATLAENAIRIWPDAPGLRAFFTKAWRRFQRLHVGVMQLPREPTEFFLPTAADVREEYLLRSTLFSVSQAPRSPVYRTPYFEQWQPEDLGREAIFRLRPGRFSWEARPEATATDIVNTFDQLLDPEHPLYDERLASYVESIKVASPLHLEVRFSRVPLRTEALLNFPLRRTAFDAKNYEGPEEMADLFSERFRPVERTENLVRYRRAIPEPDASTEFHVAEVEEHKYESHEEAIRDLLRGKIDMIARARIWHVDPLIQSNKFFVMKAGVPRVHVLQFNPKTKALRNREFRRAISHAINRERILYEDILKGADARHARLVTAPFSKSNYAYNGTIEPRSYDLTTSVSLRLASQKALGGPIPTLKMVCDPDPTIVAAANKMIAEWKRVGINVQLLNNTGQPVARDSEDWDIAYRTVVMSEPLTELWPFLTMQPRARIADLDYLPDWLRQALIELDTQNDWKAAGAHLKRLHRLLWAEVQTIPLWEVDEYAVFRKHLDGYRRDAMHTYQNIDQWTVDAWIPPEAP